MQIGLKIDVDTFRGTRLGVPPLARLLKENGQRATFFFSVGPDNMGRHLFRLLKPAFFLKMLHSNAPGLYGWDILLKGTFGPGPAIGRHLAPVFRETAALGHEIGLHAWDHHGWQAHAISRGEPAVRRQMTLGLAALEGILGRPVLASAAPGWQADAATLRAKAAFPFRYHSDCRGTSIFRPLIDGTPLSQPQIPTTLPTYDELIGHDGITHATYNAHLLSLLRPGALNVLCIHAEAEGIACFELFRDFLHAALAAGHTFTALEELLPSDLSRIPPCAIRLAPQAGREGQLAVQVPGLAFRPVTAADCRQIFDWANDPVLRRYSFRTPEPIVWENHQKWFAATLEGIRRQQYIAEGDGGPIGHIRFEKNHLDETEISVYLAPESRGKKLSSALLNEGTRHHLTLRPQDAPITAWVRMENAASLAAFRRAGWREDPAPADYLGHPAARFVFPEDR